MACCDRPSMVRATRMAPTPSHRCEPRPRSQSSGAGWALPSTTAVRAPSMPSVRRYEPAFAHPQRRPNRRGAARAGRRRRSAHTTRGRPARWLAAATGRRSAAYASAGHPGNALAIGAPDARATRARHHGGARRAAAGSRRRPPLVDRCHEEYGGSPHAPPLAAPHCRGGPRPATEPSGLPQSRPSDDPTRVTTATVV